MDNLSNVLERALATYFNVLSSTGYVCYNDVNKLLLLSLIEELTSGPMSAFIDDKDYNSMNNALYCIFGTSCLIPILLLRKALLCMVKRNLSEYLRMT